MGKLLFEAYILHTIIEYILEKSLFSVICVIRPLCAGLTLPNTRISTLERSLINATNVGKPSIRVQVFFSTSGFTQERGPLNVMNVERHSG